MTGLMRSKQPKDTQVLAKIFTKGPIGRVTRIMSNYSQLMWPGEAVLPPKTLCEKAFELSPGDWKTRLNNAIAAAFSRWRDDKVATYPHEYQEYLRRSLSRPHQKLPSYGKIGVDLGCQAPSIAYPHPGPPSSCLCLVPRT